MKNLHFLTCLLVLAGTGRAFSVDVRNDRYAGWRAYRDQLIQNKSLVRYYTFEEQGDEVKNLASDNRGSLIIPWREPYFNSALRPWLTTDFPQWTEGRFPGKLALCFRSASGSALRSMFYGTASGVLTLEAWIRPYADSSEKSEATLFSIGTGFGSGWFLMANSRATILRIGRSKTEGGDVELTVKPLSEHVWHHLVAELDRHALRLYVDGDLAGTKEFEGDFRPPQAPEGWFAQTPEDDPGGLKIGTIRQPENTLRFDCDELALYDRALLAEDVRAHFQAGTPTESAADQEQAHRALLEKQELLDSIKIEIPQTSYGYFPAGRSVPLTVVVPMAVKLASPLAVDVTIHAHDQESAFTGTKPMPLAGNENERLVWDLLLPDHCGLYQMDVSVKDATGALIVTKNYPIATTVPVPAMEDRPASSPLGGHGILTIHNEDIALGGRYERIIPWCPKLPDGRPSFQHSDPLVDQAERAGLEVLYCISPRFDLGQVNLDNIVKDPSEWERWVRAFVEHYKGRVKYWEIINEPNAAMHLAPALYVALLKSAHRIIREVDSQAKIIGLCGVWTYPEWTEDVLAAGGGNFFDILSFHNYLNSSPISAWRKEHKIQQVRTSLAKNLGKDLPIWNTEGGIVQPRRINGRPLTDAELLAKYPQARQENGVTLVKVNSITMATEHVGACWQTQSILLDCALGVERWFNLMGASNFFPQGSGSDGSPSEKGVAYAALASVLTHMKSIGLLPITSSSAAGVVIVNANGKKDVVLFADSPITRCFTVKESRVYRGMDFLGNPLKWEAKDKLLSVSFGMEPIYIFDVSDDFREADFLKVKSFPTLVSPCSQTDGVLSVTNPFSIPLIGELNMVSAKSTVSFEKNLVLGPGKSLDVPFRMIVGPLPRGDHALIVSLSQQGKELAATERSFASEGVARGIPRISRAMPLDCDSSKWQGIPEEIADTASLVVIGRPSVGYFEPNAWQGPKDLSFSVKTAWHPEDGIYFFLNVTDEKLQTVPPDQINRAFLQDALEFFFDGRSLKDQGQIYSFGVEQIFIVPSISDKVQPCRVKNLARYGESIEIKSVGRRTLVGYAIEGRIRPQKNASFKLIPGTRIGMDFVIDDASNATMTRKTQMALHGTAENNQNASHLGRYYLMDSAATPVLNLLCNADLAEGEGENIPGWRFCKQVKSVGNKIPGCITSGVKEIDGKRALSISISSKAEATTWWEQRVVAKGETPYTVSFRLGGNIIGKALWGNCGGTVFFFGNQDQVLGAKIIGTAAISAENDWGNFSGQFLTPVGTQRVGFRFNVLSNGVEGSANFYCADIILAELNTH